MKVAIVGAGVAGLSVAWHLLDQSRASLALDIFDPLAPGEGTSGLASGLLHPYTGVRAHLNWKGDRMMEEAHNLFTAASLYSEAPLIASTGILRIALSSPQASAFKECAKQHKDCTWLRKEELGQLFPQITCPEEGGALFIRRGVTLSVQHYLQALLQATQRLGACWHQKAITDPNIFAEYDQVIIAMGSDTPVFNILANLPITKIKGQTLELRWPTELPPLPMSIMGDTHVVMRPDKKSCLVGATFERDFTNPNVDLDLAKQLLLPKTLSLLPGLEHAEVIACTSGIRACPTTHKPLIGRINERFWFFTGLCAKGLLYHGYLGKKVARAVLENNSALIPREVYHHVDIPVYTNPPQKI